MTTYKLLLNDEKKASAVLRDGKDSVPFDPDNSDYQRYLKWLEEGNQPLPADEGTPSA